MKGTKKTKKELLEELAVLREDSVSLKSRLAAAEGRLQSEKERFNKFLDCLPVFAYLQAPDYSIHNANRVFRNIYGDPGKRPCYEVIWKRTAPCEECPTFRVFNTGKPEVWESNHQEDGRSYRVYDLPFTDSDGSPLVFEISLDRTESKKAEESKRNTESFYRTILEDLPDMICRWRPEGTITFVNENFCRYFGKTRDELVGKQFLPYICGDEEGGTGKGAAGFSPDKPIEYSEKKVALPGGDVRWVECVTRALFEDDGRIKEYQSIGHDITSRKNAEEENSRLQARLMQSQKMEAIGTLAGGIAHDFNNIITVIKSLTELVIGKVGTEDQLYRYLKPINESCRRAINLVQQLLLFSRNKSIDMATIDLNGAASELLGMLEHIISEDIMIETDFSYDLWKIKADKGRVEQILTNMVVNSSEAMPNGGSVTIRTENVSVGEEECGTIEGAVPGRYVCLSVEDTGSGIESPVLKRIYEPFFTTKSKNSGMGLAVVYGIVKEHHGWITVSSTPGSGTVFKVYLPATVEEEHGEVRPLLKRNVTGRGRKVLLVEDEKWVRKSTAMVLAENGYEVFEAADAEKALSLFYREKGRFDIVISDVVMPGRSGLQLVNPLLDINPRVPVLLCSGHLDDKSQLSQIIKRGLAYIQKPFDIHELLAAIEETINSN